MRMWFDSWGDTYRVSHHRFANGAPCPVYDLKVYLNGQLMNTITLVSADEEKGRVTVIESTSPGAPLLPFTYSGDVEIIAAGLWDLL